MVSFTHTVAVIASGGFVVAACNGAAWGQSTVDKPAAILFFPRVIADQTHDTVIQLVNTTNGAVSARCFYVNAAPQQPQQPPGCVPQGLLLPLTMQQPVHFSARLGGTLPPVPPVSSLPFSGALLCVAVGMSGLPGAGVATNALIGEATLKDTASGVVSKYNAVGLRGFESSNGDGVLCLGGGVTASCPTGAEYEACPSGAALNDNDMVVGAGLSVTTLSVLPCSHNFTTQTPASVALHLQIVNGFEQSFSSDTVVTCWGELSGGSGTTFLQVRVSSSGPGFVVVGEQSPSAAAHNACVLATASGDLIVLPSP